MELSSTRLRISCNMCTKAKTTENKERRQKYERVYSVVHIGLSQNNRPCVHSGSLIWGSHVCCAIYERLYIPLCGIFLWGLVLMGLGFFSRIESCQPIVYTCIGMFSFVIVWVSSTVFVLTAIFALGLAMIGWAFLSSNLYKGDYNTVRCTKM